jgi:NAD-dependent SIR2 family protein deacetylase
MQFIPEGPNIPEALLNAHADGKVVFFCGAGVSLDAGYPLFRELTEILRDSCPIKHSNDVHEAIQQGEFEFALSIIQKRLGNNAIKLRRDTFRTLSKRPLTLENHRAILRLSLTKDKACRLITTNFDRLFIKASKGVGAINIDSAPKLPIPKPERWNSVLHLHGLLPEKLSDTELGNLILTSADFGEAYVTDSYCSRFVVELLRHFVVVFIGYSLNDRIMRYLIDAISFSEKFFDDSLQKGHFHKPYAFVEHNETDKDKVIERWDIKEVTPIPYFVEEARRTQNSSHHRLYDTLDAWATFASGGQRARTTLALNEAQKPFLPEDTFTQERLLWALKDADGKVAEALARVEKPEHTASIGWLSFFAKHGLLDQTYTPQELHEIGKQNRRNKDKQEEPVYLGSITYGSQSPRLKPTPSHLVDWMQWHLNTTDLLDWILKNGGVPHPEFCRAYGHPSNDKRKQILSKNLKRIWDIITSDAYRRAHVPSNQWFDLKEDVDFSSEMDVLEFCDHVRPVLAVRPSIYRGIIGRSEGPYDQYDFELKLTNGQMGYQVGQIIAKGDNQKGLENLSSPLTELIASGLDWLALTNKASRKSDLSGFRVPSISDHEQNRHTDEFWELVFLLRTSFDRLRKMAPTGALTVATKWLNIEYPLFKRLFLYAANELGKRLDSLALDLLIQNDGQWLWAMDTKREVSVYLRERVRLWKKEQIAALCEIILQGPKRSNYRRMSDEKWVDLRENIIARYLYKLKQGKVSLPKRAAGRYRQLKERYPRDLPDDQSDEFISFVGPIRDIEWDEDAQRNPTEYRTFAEKNPAQRIAQWKESDASFLRRLAIDAPESLLKTLEEGLTKIESASFWNEGFSALARALEGMKASPKDNSSDG